MTEAAVNGTVVDGEGGLFFTLRDEAFEIRRVSISYPMMKFAKARRKASVRVPDHLPEKDPRRVKAEEARNEAGMEIMELLLDAVNILLKPHERARFDEYVNELSMSDTGLKPGELEESINMAMSAVGEAEDKGKAPGNGSPNSSTGERTTNTNSPVISSEPVTEMDGLPMKRPANNDVYAHDVT